jgi:hypothetical protein
MEAYDHQGATPVGGVIILWMGVAVPCAFIEAFFFTIGTRVNLTHLCICL